MAAAAPSPLTSSAEKTNGAKLSRLLIDGGTTVLRNVFDAFHPPANLAADLNVQYKTLLSLSRKRILNKPQWDKLFPPSGAIPDSHSFDITLLFLLLTNICGLAPPSSGWHTKPSPSDTSLEANLARIKFFRNELYGHVTSTGVETSTFISLWQEISAVLVSLGLNQAEIDRLETECCGEDDYLDVLHDWADSEQDIKLQLKDLRQCQTETQQDIARLLGSRQEDHKTLQDTIFKLEGVCQSQTKTCQAVEEVHETLQAGFHEVNQKVEQSKKRREMERAEELLRNLAKSEFKGDIEYHAQRFQEGTREWIFQKVDDWLDDRSSPNRVIVISGSAGMGKSVISSVICKRMHEAGRLLGSHFCQHNNVRYRKPQLMLQSLACHLSYALPEYKNALVDQLSRNLGPIELNSMGVEELFALLIKEPLSKGADPGKNMLMVIDGLDESEYQGRNELLDVIANQFCKLPQWIRFFVTTRPEINIANSLKHFQPIQLEESHDENLRDIQLFFEMQLGQEIEQEDKDRFLRTLVENSEGVFLYAYFLRDFVKENVSIRTPEQLEISLPLGISSVYHSHFKRLENELGKELTINEDQMSRFLCSLTASREPLPVGFISSLLNLSGRSLSVQRKISKAISCISSLLPIRDGRLHIFHKSVKDWLSNTSCYGPHYFTVDEKEGHEVLFTLCAAELDNIKRKGVNERQFNDTEKYALQHCVQHMIELDDFGDRSSFGNIEELVDNYVTNPELVYAKLVVSSTASVEDLFGVQKKANALLTEKTNSLLTTLLSLLRKHSYVLTDHPHLWFQSLINDGSPALSFKAATILEDRLPNVPYMKYLDTNEQKGAVQARFYCSDTVACFDVSPEMDYMVCECRDGTIHLWSLRSGNREWERPSFVKKDFYGCYPSGSAYRQVKNGLSFYQSVVFHPSGSLVLPGSLESVYSLSGDLISLFSKSACKFSNCLFSEERKYLLTDSPDNNKEITLWSMETGNELKRITWSIDISDFAISPDASAIAFSDVSGRIILFLVEDNSARILINCKDAVCGMIHFLSDNYTFACGFLCLVNSLTFEYEFHGNCTFVFVKQPKDVTVSPVPQATPAHNLFLWPCPSRTPTESDFQEQNEPFSWFKGLQNVIPHVSIGLYFPLNSGEVLIGSPTLKFLSVLNVASLKKEKINSINPGEQRKVTKILFSPKGDIVYFISSFQKYVMSSFEKQKETRLAVFDRENGEMMNVKTFPPISNEILGHLSVQCEVTLIPIKKGIVLFTSEEPRVPELWNFNLTECIRHLGGLNNIDKLFPVSDELIACRRNVCERGATIDILNITSGDLVSSVKAKTPDEPFPVICICCNSQQQVLISTEVTAIIGTVEHDLVTVTVSLWNTDSSLVWEIRSHLFIILNSGYGQLSFSPQEEFVVTWNCLDEGNGVHILDAKTGEIHCKFLQSQNYIVDCKFVDCESLVCCSQDNFLRLFNVRSGNLLSVLDIEERPFSLGACLDKSLVAIGLAGDRLKFIHVKLPSDTTTGDKKKV